MFFHYLSAALSRGRRLVTKISAPTLNHRRHDPVPQAARPVTSRSGTAISSVGIEWFSPRAAKPALILPSQRAADDHLIVLGAPENIFLHDHGEDD